MSATLPFATAKHLGEDLMSKISDEGLNEKVLGNWVATDPDRALLLAWTAWGAIRWDKDLGRPEGTELHPGFVIAHKAQRIGWKCAGCPEVADWLDQVDVALFDMPMDGDAYTVGYSCTSTRPADTKGGWMLYDGNNMVDVRFAPGHRWTSKDVTRADTPVHLWLQPSGQSWMATRERVFLAPIEVRSAHTSLA